MTKTFYLFIASIFVFFVSICFSIYGLFDHSNKVIDFDIEKEDEIKDETTQPPTQPPQMVAVQCPPGVILFTVCCALFFVLVFGCFLSDYTINSPNFHAFMEKKIVEPFFPLIALALIAILSIIIHKKNTLHTSSTILLTATIFILFTSIKT